MPHFLEPLIYWLAVHTGTENESGKFYAFWSGFGSDVSELVLFGGAYALWKKHNCHTTHCWRIGRHIVDGTPWCNHHHMQAREALKKVV